MIDTQITPLPLTLKKMTISEELELKDSLMRDLMEEGQITLNRQHIGFVYILGSSTGYYKIGQTTDIVKRLKKFEVALPFKIWLEISMAFYDCIWAEKYFHANFAEKRLNGEWFNLTEKDLHYFQEFSDSWMDFKLTKLLENVNLCPWSPQFIKEGLGNLYPSPGEKQNIIFKYSWNEGERLHQQTQFRDEYFLRGFEDYLDGKSIEQEQVDDDSSN